MKSIVSGLDEATYHADKESLSVSGAKKLLPPHCPARFKWERDNGQPNKPSFDFGRAAHSLVLGTGAEVVQVEADDWRSKAAREARDAAYAEGKTPVLASEWAQIVAMADAITEHPIASALLNPERGKPEQSAYWLDPAHDVLRRCRFDWLPEADGGHLVIPDYKTARSADPGTFARAAATFGYHMQAAWYADMAQALGLAEDVSLVFIVQEKVAPYLVTVVELDFLSVDAGRKRNDEALQVYRQCTDTGVWPGYAEGVEVISLPTWAFYDDEMDVA
jgi:hypothetical protein